jgi:DNA-binding FadR family transcriptional regulator
LSVHVFQQPEVPSMTTARDQAELISDSSPLQSPARNPKLAESLARDLAETIFSRGLQPGARLPSERALLDQLKVSRGTLREALRLLEAHGLIRVRPGSSGGAIVAPMDASDFNRISSLHFRAHHVTQRHIWQARLDIEPVLARLAAENLTEESRTALTTLLDRASSTQPSDDIQYLNFGSEFHRLIASSCGNPVLDLYSRSLGEMTATIAARAVFPMEARAAVHDDHQAIAKAILGGKVKQAETLMRAHMIQMRDSAAARFPAGLDSSVPIII